jgi:hypothetical protein
LTTIFQVHREDTTTNVGVNGAPVTRSELGEHLLGRRNDLLITGHASRAEHQSLELLLD